MNKLIQEYHARILIGIVFYLAGFFVTAALADLSGRDIVVGLIAGAICGTTMLIVTLGKSTPSTAREICPPAV